MSDTEQASPEAAFIKCSKCGKEKPRNKFSLKIGVRSSLRKGFCSTCESQTKTAKKYGLELHEYWAMLERPCYICGQKSELIDGDKRGRIRATWCRRCSALSRVLEKQDKELIQGVYNYLYIRQQFPFFLRAMLKIDTANKEVPLINWIEKHER